MARERDLCDVKIKITEYFPGAKLPELNESTTESNTITEPHPINGEHSPITNILGSNDRPQTSGISAGYLGRYYVIQRVNGNGANGKEMASSDGHRHTIDDSDKIKKNSIHRFFLKEEKERRKSQVRRYVL